MNDAPPATPPPPPAGPPPTLSGSAPATAGGKGSILVGVLLGLAIPIASLFVAASMASGTGGSVTALLVLIVGLPVGILIASMVAFARAGKTRIVGGMLIGAGIVVMLIVACFSLVSGMRF